MHVLSSNLLYYFIFHNYRGKNNSEKVSSMNVDDSNNNLLQLNSKASFGLTLDHFNKSARSGKQQHL